MTQPGREGMARDKVGVKKPRSGTDNGDVTEVAASAPAPHANAVTRATRSSTRTQQGSANQESASAAKKLDLPKYKTKVKVNTVDPEPDDVVVRVARKSKDVSFTSMSLNNRAGQSCVVTARDLVTIADGQCLTDAIIDFHNILLSIEHPRTPNGKTWAVMDSMAYQYATGYNKPFQHGKGESLLAVDFLAIPVFKGNHYSLIIVCEPAKLFRKDGEGDGDKLQMVLFDSEGTHAGDPTVFDGAKLLLDITTKQLHPECDHERLVSTLWSADCVVMQSDFSTVLKYLYLDGVSGGQYRRRMRADLSAHAACELVPALTTRGKIVPPQYAPRTSEIGAVRASDEVDMRSRLAQYQVEVYGLRRELVIWGAAMTALGNAMGYSRDQMLAAAAYVVKTEGGAYRSIEPGGSPSTPPHLPTERTGGPLPAEPCGVQSCAKGGFVAHTELGVIHRHPRPLPPLSRASPAHDSPGGPKTPTNGNGEVGPGVRATTEVLLDMPAAKRGEKRPRVDGGSLAAEGTTAAGGGGGSGGSSQYTGSMLDHSAGGVHGSSNMETSDASIEPQPASRSQRVSKPPSYLRNAYQLTQKRQRGRKAERSVAVPAKRARVTKAKGVPLNASAAPETSVAEAPQAEVEISVGAGDEDIESESEARPAPSRSKNLASVMAESQATATTRPRPPPVRVPDNPFVAMPVAGSSRDPTAPGEETHILISRAEFEALKKAQEASARTVARLEEELRSAKAVQARAPPRRPDEHVSGSGGASGRKRKRREELADEETSDEESEDEPPTKRGHLRVSKSPVLQRALNFLPANKSWKRACDLVKDYLFFEKENARITFYPSSDDKTVGVCAVIERLPFDFATLALAADKARRSDLNKALSEWKSGAAGRTRDISCPRMGLFRDERDTRSPWATKKDRTLEEIRSHYGLLLGVDDPLALSKFGNDREGMPFASGAFVACAVAAFKPKKVVGPLTVKLYHLAWLEHVAASTRLDSFPPLLPLISAPASPPFPPRIPSFPPLLPLISAPASPHFRPCFPSFPPTHPLISAPASPHFRPCFPSFPPTHPLISAPASPHFRPCFPSFPPTHPLISVPASPHFRPCFPSFPPTHPLISVPASPHFRPCIPSFPPLLPLLSPHASPHFRPCFPSFPPTHPLISAPASPHFRPCLPSFPPLLPLLSPTSSPPFPHCFPSFPPLLPLLSPTASPPFPHCFPSFPPLLPLLSPTASPPFPHCFPSFPPLLPLLSPTASPPFPHCFPSFPPLLPLLSLTASPPFPHCFPSFPPLLPLLSPTASPPFPHCFPSFPPLLPLLSPTASPPFLHFSASPFTPVLPLLSPTASPPFLHFSASPFTPVLPLLSPTASPPFLHFSASPFPPVLPLLSPTASPPFLHFSASPFPPVLPLLSPTASPPFLHFSASPFTPVLPLLSPTASPPFLHFSASPFIPVLPLLSPTASPPFLHFSASPFPPVLPLLSPTASPPFLHFSASPFPPVLPLLSPTASPSFLHFSASPFPPVLPLLSPTASPPFLHFSASPFPPVLPLLSPADSPPFFSSSLLTPSFLLLIPPHPILSSPHPFSPHPFFSSSLTPSFLLLIPPHFSSPHPFSPHPFFSSSLTLPTGY
ncbi:unnamed protein product [Closterium sp. Yama58-4]|nr:unnamed protein product [Closterium sp. Yama58-4]